MSSQNSLSAVISHDAGFRYGVTVQIKTDQLSSRRCIDIQLFNVLSENGKKVKRLNITPLPLVRRFTAAVYRWCKSKAFLHIKQIHYFHNMNYF